MFSMPLLLNYLFSPKTAKTSLPTAIAPPLSTPNVTPRIGFTCPLMLRYLQIKAKTAHELFCLASWNCNASVILSQGFQRFSIIAKRSRAHIHAYYWTSASTTLNTCECAVSSSRLSHDNCITFQSATCRAFLMVLFLVAAIDPNREKERNQNDIVLCSVVFVESVVVYLLEGCSRAFN